MKLVLNMVGLRTYELLLLIGDQFSDLTFTGCQLFLVVCEITNDKLLLAGMQFKFFDNFLEKCDVEQCVVSILADQLR